MTGHLIAHLARRGQEYYTQREAYINSLQEDAELYEKSGQSLDPVELLPVILTGLAALFVISLIDYTVGQVISSLAMIEAPSSTAIIESKPPAYADEPNAPQEKELLIPAEAEADVEITVIDHKPITASIRGTVKHLHRVGGFSARWRGIGLSIFYQFLHGTFTNLLAGLLGFGLAGEVICFTIVSIGLCRVHMAWTHKMITQPTNEWWFRRIPARKDCKALLLPTLVYAVSQQATLILPIGVAFALGVAGPQKVTFSDTSAPQGCAQFASMFLRLLAVPVTYIAVAFLILLPASVTLTRIEAALLPEGQETIVPFDKAAILSDLDLSARRGRRALCVEAWRSFDRSSRWRIVKLYIKMYAAELAVVFIAAHVMLAELYLLGTDRLAIFFRSAIAQVKLMAIEAHEKSN